MVLNDRRELWIARTCTLATLIALSGLYYCLFMHADAAFAAHRLHSLVEACLFGGTIFFVAYGNLLYQICLVGYYKRRLKHRPASRESLESLYLGEAPSLAILIPSYKEEYTVNLQTMMSAALSEYPAKDVVLLIDDPIAPKTQEDRRMLEVSRALPGQLQAMFDAPKLRFTAERDAYLARKAQGKAHPCIECNRLSLLYDEVAEWLENLAMNFLGGRDIAAVSHIDRFYVERVLADPARAHRMRACELRSHVGSSLYTPDDILRQYQRLIGLFTVTFKSFERKKYANLSHEANKAMNLNSYISLMGKSWRQQESTHGLMLEECAPEDADFTIPAPGYVNTIDADSMMLSDYVLRLIHHMEKPEHARIAVIQSPCSAYPGGGTLLERAAGAAIDVQFKTHQGYTYWNATFWVGANAVLRFAALKDIREIRYENGHPISVYIQDKTVIEDTESSIDLVHKGWQLYNYPERMTFSAMPSDFGSLLIQRRRWANGGLLILPKLVHYLFRARKDLGLLKETFMRLHYLISSTSGCLVALLLLGYPFSDGVTSIWLPLSALPFMLLYIRDLRNTGHSFAGMLRICALNLMLLPVITGGVLKSFEQMLTGRKIPFVRTPKIPGRTAAPAFYCLIELIAPLACLGIAIVDLSRHQLLQASVALSNFGFLAYALIYFMGVKETLQDVGLGARNAAGMVMPLMEEAARRLSFALRSLSAAES